MTGLPDSYVSPVHLPFNRASLSGKLVLQGPTEDQRGEGYGVLLLGSRLLVTEEQEAPRLPVGAWSEQSLYLGQWQGRPCRLILLNEDQAVPDGLTARNLLDEKPRLPIDLLSLGGMARMISHWQVRSRFCGSCGQSAEWLPGEWGRTCPACKSHAFPAIHPCAIVLVCRPGEVLLTRKATWAPNRYSLVAGFQDFGESLEETAMREISEETGIIAKNVRYVGSQCWPFPSQVMVGFVADYAEGEVQVDREELDDARWFPINDLPQLPPKRSIARYILDTTLQLP
jgi:NAD+ diphosphatase